MPLIARKAPDIGRGILLHSVHSLVSGRDRCADCRRTPLLGERVHAMSNGRQVCELCRQRRGEEPVSSAIVRGPQQDHHVRLTVRAA